MAVRMAFFYAVSFSGLGVIVPFLPAWMAHRGLEPSDIAIVLALGQVIRIVGNTSFGRLADILAERRLILMGLTVASLLSFAALLPAWGFWHVLAAYLVANLFYPAQVALTENLGVIAAYQRGYDYGRVRLWGSITFILGTLVVGWVMPVTGKEGILWLALAALALTASTAWLLPVIDIERRPRMPKAISAFLCDPVFLLFLGANAFVQSSHAAYYTFATLHWQKAGLSDFVIGLVWSEGVVAEILLFAFSARFVNRLRPTLLILIGALGGILRWGVLAATTDPLALLAVNWLHACSFAFAHLGAMHFIARAIRPGLSATAQGLYTSLGISVAVSVATLVIGPLYAAQGGVIFMLMSGFCVVAALLAFQLDRQWSGGELALKRLAPA
ncbi:MAG: MFS transporter [Zavarzinia sp.]|nr:MFS transporter [Zavarzinia sp.]